MSTQACPEGPVLNPAKKRGRFLLFWGLVLLLGLTGFFSWFYSLRFIAYTDDAYVEGNQVYITPLRPGFITAIHTDDTFLVTKGQLLIQLDETDSRIALGEAQQELAKAVRDVCQAVHQVFVYQAESEIKTARLIRDAQDYKHRYDVIHEEGVSIEDFEHAVAAFRSSYFSYKQTKILYEKALAFVQDTSIRSHPLVQAAMERVRFAWVQLYRCKIYAPVEGLVAQRQIQVGMWVAAGQPLLSIIPLDQIWVNANYKETQLKDMRIGQKVKIRSDLYGSEVIYEGTIVGLPGGAGNAFSLLPPQNLSGNWIKIVQRLPVRVALDPHNLKQYPLRVGLSMEAFVDLRDQQGTLVPITTAGSPHYSTAIFEEEERGVHPLIEQILGDNMDATLREYAHYPLHLQPIELSAEIKEYLHKIGFEKIAEPAPSP